ncbi:tail fiber assembly protein [Enterobacter sp. Bisph1]|uniref:tail fiber assembly protein n=1 Tax=Enterobacter sp. Bisph1 TaxID=1274399 RepID=UPI00057C09C1|nr:tail fiber assembly protein [Enterobacter sp. Bisph1]
MSTATLNKNRLATETGEITVYNFNATTREYLSTSIEYLVVGVGIPANATLDAPLAAKEGYAVCRSTTNETWEYIPDHRGETVYDIENGKPVPLTELGDYPADVTSLVPATPYDKWNGSAWVTDENAQKTAQVDKAEQSKTQRLIAAKNTISLWQTELQLGVISDDDKKQLIAWLNYIKLVQAVDTSTAPDVSWPAQP